MDRRIFEPKNADSAQVEDDFSGIEKEENSLDSFLKKADLGPIESKDKDFARDYDKSSGEGIGDSKSRKEIYNFSLPQDPFISSFLIELIHSIKNTLISIKNTSSLSADRFSDMRFRRTAQENITEDIRQIDSVLNSLLNYIHINTPIIKSNTISNILEEVLEANKKQIECKRIKIFKKCEKDLPEALIHDEQMRFILNSVLQYAILSAPPGGTIGFLIKSFDFHNRGPDGQISPGQSGGYIEAAVGFIGDKERSDLGNPHVQKEETTKLILKLVKEILQNNHGGMAYEVDPKKPRTLITLRFPIERRRVVYYEPLSI